MLVQPVVIPGSGTLSWTRKPRPAGGSEPAPELPSRLDHRLVDAGSPPIHRLSRQANTFTQPANSSHRNTTCYQLPTVRRNTARSGATVVSRSGRPADMAISCASSMSGSASGILWARTRNMASR